jgi:lipopolysaccharide/colanic/teichoic acid biosynthesis glycosyltransferase
VQSAAGCSSMTETFYQRRGKRLLDLLLAGPLLVVSLPVQAVVAILVVRRMGRPVLFRQLRPGRHGEVFELVKFRTMREPDARVGQGDDAARMTALGSVLRATSLDELPTLLNVLKGDMSMVGPRPLLLDYMSLYSMEQRRRHDVRPGITGLAQVNGRNTTDWLARLRYDVRYVEALDLRTDLSIIRQTMRQVLRRQGIAQDGHVTMPRFTGADPCDV